MARTKQTAAQRNKARGKAAPRRKTGDNRRNSRHSTLSNIGGDYHVGDDDDDNDYVDVPESDGDSEESAGGGLEEARVALRALQTAMERAEKKDNFAKEFEKRVRDEEKRLLEMLGREHARMQSDAEKFRSQVTSLLTSALAPSLSTTAKDGSGIRGEKEESGLLQAEVLMESNALYIASQTLLARSHALLKSYDKINGYLSNAKPLPNLAEQWEKDYAEVQRLIVVGGEAAAAEMEKLIVYDKTRGKEPCGRETKRMKKTKKRALEQDENLKMMLEMGRAEDDEGSSVSGKGGEEKQICGWGTVAHRLEKGLQVLIRALPEEGERKKKRV
ncbi:hypothetical protein PRK78_003801 [Emydomyces testavorans]|uniref:Uncharacterized protein n=1 Tax=Emydomyces testavorans TaxID=2070801 RepID=A0AAF0IIP3_9EURO|nr:hypothetical protein PRK78_003801 [Emydomyces testavorans]